MFVKPAEGRTVRRPDTLVFLLPDGEEVPRDEFWTRRLRDGDVTEEGETPVEEAADADPQSEAIKPDGFFEISKSPHSPADEPSAHSEEAQS